MTFLVRRARTGDAAAASRIAIAAKAYWGYAPAVMASWEPQLRFSPEYIAANAVFIAELDGSAVGVAALEEYDTYRELGHLWVLPSAQGRGLGSALLGRVLKECAGRPGPLRVESDPNAAAFYERAGGVRVGEREAAIPSDATRTLPVFEFNTGGREAIARR